MVRNEHGRLLQLRFVDHVIEYATRSSAFQCIVSHSYIRGISVVKQLFCLLVLCGSSSLLFGCGKSATPVPSAPPTAEEIQENEEMGAVPVPNAE